MSPRRRAMVRTAHPTGADRSGAIRSIVPTSRRRTVRVGMQPGTLRVPIQRTQSILSGVTTQSVGTSEIQSIAPGRPSYKSGGHRIPL